MRVSARNQIPAKVRAIRRGEAMATVELDAGGQTLVASITAESVDDLGIEVGRDVFAVIKATDVMIGIAPV